MEVAELSPGCSMAALRREPWKDHVNITTSAMCEQCVSNVCTYLSRRGGARVLGCKTHCLAACFNQHMALCGTCCHALFLPYPTIRACVAISCAYRRAVTTHMASFAQDMWTSDPYSHMVCLRPGIVSRLGLGHTAQRSMGFYWLALARCVHGASYACSLVCMQPRMHAAS